MAKWYCFWTPEVQSSTWFMGCTWRQLQETRILNMPIFISKIPLPPNQPPFCWAGKEQRHGGVPSCLCACDHYSFLLLFPVAKQSGWKTLSIARKFNVCLLHSLPTSDPLYLRPVHAPCALEWLHAVVAVTWSSQVYSLNTPSLLLACNLILHNLWGSQHRCKHRAKEYKACGCWKNHDKPPYFQQQMMDPVLFTRGARLQPEGLRATEIV